MKKLRRKTPSPSTGSSSGGSNKKKLALLGLAIAGGLFYLFQDETPAPETPPAMPAREAPPPQQFNIPKPPEIISDNTPTQGPVDMEKFRKRAYANKELGVKKLKLGLNNGVMKIPLKFHPHKRWCQGGDLDTIKFLRPDPNADEFLVTIESITGKQRGDKMRVSAKKLLEGFDRDFSIPIRKDTESLGLYICRDKGKTNTCRSKVVTTHADITESIADKKTTNEALNKDYVLYFQNFIVKDGELLTYSNDDVRPETIIKLRKHLTGEYGVETPDFNAAYEINKVLRSVSAKIENGTIKLNLPYNDPRCTPGAGAEVDTGLEAQP